MDKKQSRITKKIKNSYLPHLLAIVHWLVDDGFRTVVLVLVLVAGIGRSMILVGWALVNWRPLVLVNRYWYWSVDGGLWVVALVGQWRWSVDVGRFWAMCMCFICCCQARTSLVGVCALVICITCWKWRCWDWRSISSICWWTADNMVVVAWWPFNDSQAG